MRRGLPCLRGGMQTAWRSCISNNSDKSDWEAVSATDQADRRDEAAFAQPIGI